MSLISDYFNNWLKWPVFVRLIITFAVPPIIPLLIIYYLKYYRYLGSLKKLKGKVVLITGASSGFGEALAHSFYKAGCRVILSARRENELERVRDTLLQMYQTSPTYPPVVLPLDVTNTEMILKQAKKALSLYGYIDILVNNAGISYRGSIVDTKVDVDKQLMIVNYLGPVTLIKAILPEMIKRKEGHIVAISSIQGLIGIPHRSAYAASKHALQAFHDSLRAEVAEHNIKVTVISPGYIKTNLSINALTSSGEKYKKMDETTNKGQDPMDLAEILLKAISIENPNLLTGSLTSKAAVYIRYFYPSFYFWIMERRAKTTLPS